MKYRLTEAAVRDVREIVRHIRLIQKSPQNATLVALRLKHQFEVLVESRIWVIRVRSWKMITRWSSECRGFWSFMTQC
jgi:hypothetical protein